MSIESWFSAAISIISQDWSHKRVVPVFHLAHKRGDDNFLCPSPLASKSV